MYITAVKDQGLDAGQAAKLRKSCDDFEALFIGYLFKQMRQTVPEDSLVSGGRGESIFRDMQDDEVAQEMSHTRSLGLGEMLYRDLATSMRIQKEAHYASGNASGV